tara:strand:- start:973 stop:1305 length:333 start_codon:yes stop_codon:yes gene_type:complete
MIDKQIITEIMQAAGLGFLGCVGGFMTFADRIGFKLAVRYALFALICGPFFYYLLDNSINYNTYKHIGAIAAGFGGFFVFKGVGVVLMRFSNKPVITAKDIIDLMKRSKK